MSKITMWKRWMGASSREHGGKRLVAAILFSLIIFAAPILAFADGPTGRGTFLSVADLHFDPFADPSLVNRLVSADYREWQKILEKSNVTRIGRYGKDVPYQLVMSALDALHQVSPHPDFILFSGDLLAHDFRDAFVKRTNDKDDAAYRRFVEKTVRFLALMFDSRFPAVPIIPTLGNNDSDCGDYGVEVGGEFLKMFALVWAPLIIRDGSPDSFLETFPVGGYYKVSVPALKDHVIIVLNANLFSAKARKCCSENDDSGAKELLWLDWALYQSSLEGKRVWLLFHEPVGVDVYASLRATGDCRSNITMMLNERYNTGLMNILDKYGKLIDVSFSGHTHMDDFRVVSSDGNPKYFIHITPSVSPVFGNNPAFQRFEYDKGFGTITDYATYILKNFSTARNGEDSEWEMEYDYDMAYGQKGYTLANAVDLYKSLKSNSAVRSEFMRFYSSGTMGVISDKNWKAFWCGIGNVFAGDFAACYCGGN
jgi:hypothetical protein